jgi:mannosylglycerate hydrolase
MVDAPIETRAQLHIITYLDWQREGQYSFDTQRAALLDMLAQLLYDLENDSSLKHVLLSGQTIILDDIGSVGGDLLKRLIEYSKAGKVSVGTSYVQLDGLLADGEALVRNLLLARGDALRHGISSLRVAFMPDVCQNVAQLPQILRGFDIDAAFLCFGNPILPLPFRWEAPDGSSILVMNYQALDDANESVKNQRDAQPDGPFLWMHRATTPDNLLPEKLDSTVDVPTLQSNLNNYAEAVRDKLPDELRPRIRGELHLQSENAVTGRFSARISHKQELVRLQSKLAHLAEPLLALALAYGKTRFPEIQRALLEYSWRLLMQNMSSHSFAGAVSDPVFDEMTIRNRRVDDNSQRVIDTALKALAGEPLATGATPTSDETYINVWNPHGHRVTQVVELVLRLPDGKHPQILLGPTGEEQAFTWDNVTKTLDFRADVASVGYAVYTLRLSRDKTAAYNQRRAVAGRAIGSASGESLGLVGGRLDWTFDNANIIDLLHYEDGGDAGDVWQYQEPQPDVIMKGSIVDVVQVEATPTYERLIFRNRMRIAPNLKDGKERVRGLRVLDLTTTATYYNDVPGVYFRTSFTNTAEDHRLRAHIRTGIDASVIYTDSAFGLVKRSTPDGKPTGEQPMQSMTTIFDNHRGMGLFTRGLNAFEPIKEDKQITLALTLLRSVGWLDKARNISVAGAQMVGDYNMEFMLMPLSAEREPAAQLQAAMAYRAPLKAFQYQEKPAQMQASYLSFDSDKVVMTALKPPQEGSGMVVRLLNPSKAELGVQLQPEGNLTKAQRLNLAETQATSLAIEKNQLNLSIEPYQLVTLHLEF